MKDKLTTLTALLAIAIPLGTILDGAKAQNASSYGNGHWIKTKRERQIDECMKLPDINDVRRCVEGIR